MIRPVFLLLLLCLPAVAEDRLADGLAGRPVLAIHFQSETAADEDHLRQLLAVRVNEVYLPAKIRESIERLYATGRFADIQVDAQQQPQGLVLTFITKDNFFIGDVRVEGVREPPTERQMVNAMRLELGDLYTEEKLERGLQGLRRLLEENGYRRARIKPQLQFHKDIQQVDIRFVVDAGERAHIQEVQVAGEAGFPAKTVMEKAGLTTGTPAIAQRLQNALVRLRSFYEDREHLAARVQILERRYLPGSNGERVVLRVDAGPRVTVRLAGDGLSRRTLKTLLPFYEEGSLDPELAQEGARNLRDYYQGKGYFEVEVQESRREDPQSGVVRIEYQVKKGPRHTLDLVEIRGNRYFDQRTLRERMWIAERGLLSRGRYSRSLLERDVATIRDLYESNGFREVKITSQVEDNYQGNTDHLRVRLNIEEGPQAVVRHLTITGNRQVPAQELLEEISQQEGQPFSDFNAGMDRDSILAYYYDRGFAEALFQWKAIPVAGENRVDLEYSIEEGERQFVNRMLVAGRHFTRPQVIDRQLQLKEGKPLSQSDLLETQRRLYDLGVLNKVDMALQNPEGRETERNVLFQIEEAKRWTLAVGGGAEVARIGGGDFSLENPEGATGFSPRVSLDVTRLNFRGLNHTVSFKSRVSTLQQRAAINYTAPRVWNLSDWTLFFNSFYDRTRDVRTFTARRLEGSAALEQKRSKSDTLLYRYSYRLVNVEEATLKIRPDLIPLLSRPVRVGMLSASLIRDRRDDPADSRKGTYLTADLGVSARQVGSEASFNRFLGQYTTYHSLGKGLVLARTTQFGLQEPFGELRRVGSTFTREIPLPERFFSGGGNSHRGFSVNQAGPRDPETGFPVGGNGLFLNSVELRFPVRRPDAGGVLFHDMGNVFRRVGDISFRAAQRDLRTCSVNVALSETRCDFDYMVHAVGAGVRFKTPIGPLRLDLAWSLNPPRFLGLHGSQSDLLRNTAPRDRRRLDHFQFFFSIGQTY